VPRIKVGEKLEKAPSEEALSRIFALRVNDYIRNL
jgi:hypothetical protein